MFFKHFSKIQCIVKTYRQCKLIYRVKFAFIVFGAAMVVVTVVMQYCLKAAGKDRKMILQEQQ